MDFEILFNSSLSLNNNWIYISTTILLPKKITAVLLLLKMVFWLIE